MMNPPKKSQGISHKPTIYTLSSLGLSRGSQATKDNASNSAVILKNSFYMTLAAAICLSFTTTPAFAKTKAKSEPIASFGKKRDNHTPIEVTADSLEVLQEESKATFSGHVVAIQGDLRLTAESMTVYYAMRDAAPAKKKGEKAGEENAIKKIEASGNVFLATPDETASGALAVYDVDEQEIRMDGRVTLTRGKNVLEGEKLVYNFATGKSKIVSGVTSAPGVPAASKGRVRALFVPEKNGAKDGK